MMLVLLARMLESVAFRAKDFNNQGTQIEQNSLLDPELAATCRRCTPLSESSTGRSCRSKENLVQVTRCTVSQMIKLAYWGFQSSSGVKQYKKFHEPIVTEPADCRLAAKTGKFKLNGKEYSFEMNIRRSVIVNLVGGPGQQRQLRGGDVWRASEEPGSDGSV